MCALERVSQCFPSPSDSPLLPPSPSPFSSRSLNPLRVSLSLRFSSLFSPIYGSTFLLLYQASTLFLIPSPTRTREIRARSLYTRAHVLTYIRLQGFCSWRPILSDNEDDPFSSGVRGRRGADGRGDTILPSCRGRDIFSLSRDNLETGVALPARESSEGERLGPGQNAPLPMPPVHPHSTLFC